MTTPEHDAIGVVVRQVFIFDAGDSGLLGGTLSRIDRSTLESFIQTAIAEAVEEERKRFDMAITELLREYSNTPLDQRTNAWDWLVRLRNSLTKE